MSYNWVSTFKRCVAVLCEALKRPCIKPGRDRQNSYTGNLLNARFHWNALSLIIIQTSLHTERWMPRVAICHELADTLTQFETER